MRAWRFKRMEGRDRRRERKVRVGEMLLGGNEGKGKERKSGIGKRDISSIEERGIKRGKKMRGDGEGIFGEILEQS